MDPAHVIEKLGEGSFEEVRALLSGAHRVDGLFVLWGGAARLVRTVADELGLVIGKDLHLVGWTMEELYEFEYAKIFKGCELPPAVVWRAADMAETALERLDRLLEPTPMKDWHTSRDGGIRKIVREDLRL